MSQYTLEQVEAQLDELIERYERLKHEHLILCNQKQRWQQERERLTEKNELACARIEAVLQRLKSIEMEARQ